MGMDANGLPLDHIDEEDLREDHVDDDIQEDYGSGGPTVKGVSAQRDCRVDNIFVTASKPLSLVL